MTTPTNPPTERPSEIERLAEQITNAVFHDLAYSSSWRREHLKQLLLDFAAEIQRKAIEP